MQTSRLGPSSDEPALINSFGVWTLRRLGSGDLNVPVDAPKTTASIQYRLRAGTRQGPGHWYVIHVHFRITFADDSGPGFVLLSANTNGWASYQAKFYPAIEDGVMTIPWATLDLIDGLHKGVARGRTVEYRSANYMQYRGIQPGLSSLNFQLEQFDQARVAALRIFADSGIELTRIGYGRMGLGFTVAPAKIEAGESFAVRFEIRHLSGRVLRNVSLAPELVDCSGVRLVAPRIVRFRQVAKAVAGYFHFRALGPGPCRIFFWGHSNSQQPAKEIDITVHPARH